MQRQRCGVTGKERWTKEEAANSREHFRKVFKVRGSITWCVFCESYHMSKNVRGKRRKK